MKISQIKSRVWWSLGFIIASLTASHFGYAASPDEVMTGGFALAGIGSIDEITDLLKEQGQTFEEFTRKNDEKYKRLEDDFLEFAKKANRPNIGGSLSGSSREMVESKNQLADYIRSRGETKMNSQSGPDGGWAVQPALAAGIGTIVRQDSALRTLVNFTEIETGGSFEELVSIEPAAASWVGESQARPNTTSPKLAMITTPLHEVYANPTLTQKLADDPGVSMVDFLTNECGITFAEAEETALFLGSGVNQPLGLDKIATAATTDAAGTRPFGTIEHVVTGVSGAFNASFPFDAVKTIFYRLRSGYRSNASWVCNSETALALSTIKDGQGNFLWDEGNIQSGTPPTLLGKPVVIVETCPAIAANSKSLWFGDFRQALRAIERPGNKVLLDPFSDKPNLQVYVYRRIGLQLRNSNALKVLKFSA